MSVISPECSLAVSPSCTDANHRGAVPKNGTETKPSYSNSELFPMSFNGGGQLGGEGGLAVESPHGVNCWGETRAL